MTGEVCTDNRFILIAKYFELLKERTNIETSYEEMQVIENVLFRFWQCRWLDTLEKERDGTLVEVVRCKDCRFFQTDGCRYDWPVQNVNDYCSKGERKED